jgi:quinolinate synthase
MPIAAIYGPDDFAHTVLRDSTPPRRRATLAEPTRALPMPSLEWTPEVERLTAHLYERVKNVIAPVEWPFMAPYVKAINELKKTRDAVILAHNYQTPEIFHCVADIRGDSLQLAIEATKVKSDIIVQCGVHFMAETSKILNPNKTVLIPDSRAGCSLASSITAADVRLLRERFPGVPVVAYVNTSAEVKAEVDICCTSSNAVQVVESLHAPTVIFLPDQYLAKYVASQTKVKIIAWKGACEVHERFTGDELRAYRDADPSVQIIAHPECPPDVLAEADFTGSTAHRMLNGRQCPGRDARCRNGAAVQSVSAHEADHAAQDSGQPGLSA